MALRPEISWNTSTTTARTSRICTKPPRVYDVTSPKNHSTSRITKIVQSIFLLSLAIKSFRFVLSQPRVQTEKSAAREGQCAPRGCGNSPNSDRSSSLRERAQLHSLRAGLHWHIFMREDLA